MGNVYYRITQFVFLSIFASFSLALAQSDTTLFNCLTSDSVVPPAAPAGQRTLSPVAIYACGTYAGNKQLPSWAARIWHPDSQHSAPRFYRDNSLGKPLPSGVYFYKLKAGDEVETRRMVFL